MIENFAYEQKPSAVHGYANTIKGGLRTVSGAIIETVLRYAHK